MILTFSFMHARAAAIFSAVTRFLAVAENVIFSGQRTVSSHFFSFPPVVLNCSSSYKDRDKFRIHDELKSAYLFIVEMVERQPTLILLDDVATVMTLVRRDLGCGNRERASWIVELSSSGASHCFCASDLALNTFSVTKSSSVS